MKENKKLLIFDFDGTLIDSVPDLANSVNYTLNELNIKTYKEDIIRQWVGNGASTLIKRALSGSVDISLELDEDLYNKGLKIFLEYYSNHLCDNTVMYDNVKETLTTLKNQGYILTIVTNKPYDFIKPILDKLDIEKLFSYYIGADSLSVKKPNPEPLLHICNKFNISVDSSVMIGDSKNDILAANSANMESIGVTYGYNYDESIDKYKPSLIIDDFKKILLNL
ncbi:MAG: phosphoglycolate phosphatase [Campylobacterota bacterium]|nr:phosphoglycolate phosphatase [Campylobacterota bacterium]